jgi:hypothetical protein
MIKLKHTIPTAAAAVFAALLAAPFPAQAGVAGIVIDAATVDGGATTTVAPGASIEVEITVSGSGNVNWQCTEYQIEGGAVMDAGTAAHNENQVSGAVETFNITAPVALGEYDLDLDIWSNGGCNSNIDSLTLTDAIVVEQAPPPIIKSLVSGPTDGAGTDIDLQTIFGLGAPPSPDSNDDGVIGVGLGIDGIGTGDDQHYVFRIEVTDLPDGTVIYDVVPAEYNLDPNADGAPANGVDVTGDCTATPRQPPSADVKDERFKEPELITIVMGDGGGGDFSCTVDVFVVTDGNPGHYTEPSGPFTLWEPTSCLAFLDENDELLTDDDGDPIVDSIALNDGYKEYDPVTGDRLSGPIGSLQLTPVGCDSDDDGVIDELDDCPVDGPPEAGQIEGDPGCWIDPA